MNTRSFSSSQRSLGQAAWNFIATPASPAPLAALRIGLALVLLAQAFALASSLDNLYGNRGLVQWRLIDSSVVAGVPRIYWLTQFFAPFGLTNDAALRGTFLAYVTALACLLVGWRTRPAAIVAWLTHLALNSAGNATIYGVDSLAHIALFYCVWMPVGATLSLDRLAGRETGAATPTARLALRVLQLQMCIVYLASGIEKAMGEQWWNGEAIWRAMNWPSMGQFDVTWLAQVPFLAVLLCWGTLLVEISYPLFIWSRRTRFAMAVGIIGLHVGIGGGMGLVSFAAVMIVLNIAALLVNAEPAAATSTAPAVEPQACAA